MRRLPKAWRWPVAGLLVAGVGSMVLPMNNVLWYALGCAMTLTLLVRIAHREVPFGLALAQWRLGPDDESLLRARLASAVQCAQQGSTGLAVERLEALVPDLAAALGDDHTLTLQARFIALQLRSEHGHVPGRVAAMEGLSEEMNAALGPGDPETLAARIALAEWLQEDGDTDAAQEVYRQAVSVGTQELGADHQMTLIARGSLAVMRHDTPGAGRSAALEELAAVVRDMERVLGASHPNTVSTRRLLDQWTAA
ncbi:tetratricopeptide repeat protein [Streptomyces sp. NPDC000987]|uniref:tetratricopeptide repeat protein n=1 Tax=Streptomyces sp. NPDC000987 TaxID=3154374 RepID=UPI003326D9C2